MSSVLITVSKLLSICFIITRQSTVDAQSSSCGCCPSPYCQAKATPCSTNSDCECLMMAMTGAGMCTDTVMSCNDLVPCASDNKTCTVANTVCVNNTRCGIPVCYPIARASSQRCPLLSLPVSIGAPPNSIVYSQSFTNLATPSSQCTAWNAFQALLVSTRSYSTLTISGSNDMTGIKLTNSTMVASIAQALRTNSTYGPVSSNGYSWAVGLCGNGYELTTTGSICNCNTGYTIRPCIGNSNWGGVYNTTCAAASQTITVTFK